MSEELQHGLRANVLGVGVTATSLSGAVLTVASWIESGSREYVCVATVHGVMESRRDPALRRVLNAAGMTTPDGMPLVWCCRLDGHRATTRVYGPDLMLACCAQLPNVRHYFYGGAEGVPDLLTARLTERYPGLVVAGAYSPPFRPLTADEQQREYDRINGARADIVWIGLGAPKQERWMAAARPALMAPVLVGVGAAFDFHAGVKRQAPLFMQRSGLEWLFRLKEEPRRLWRRYLLYNPAFVAGVVMQRTGLRRYPLD